MRKFRSFKDYLYVEQNYATFQQYLQQTGQTFPQLVQKLQASRPTGKGGNADFYRIPDTDFGIRILRGATPSGAELTAAHDPFDGQNFGQPVATYGDRIQVLRLQHGTPAGMPYGYDRKNPAEEQNAVQVFRQQLLHAAAMPLQEYERLMNQIIYLNQKGYVIDPSKSGNMLIDPQSGRFNLVDLNPRSSNGYSNNAGEIIVMLVNNFSFSKYFREDEEMKAAARQIIQKVEAASKSTGLPLEMGSSVQYSYELANGG